MTLLTLTVNVAVCESLHELTGIVETSPIWNRTSEICCVLKVFCSKFLFLQGLSGVFRHMMLPLPSLLIRSILSGAFCEPDACIMIKAGESARASKTEVGVGNREILIRALLLLCFGCPEGLDSVANSMLSKVTRTVAARIMDILMDISCSFS